GQPGPRGDCRPRRACTLAAPSGNGALTRLGAVRLLPTWARGYERAWLVPDILAGVIVWSVVVPQAVAYAQIAGLPPSAGLAAAPGALLAYSWLGTSRTLVVSATTATSPLSASAGGAPPPGPPAPVRGAPAGPRPLA